MTDFRHQNITLMTKIIMIFNFTRDKDIRTCPNGLWKQKSSCATTQRYFLYLPACQPIMTDTAYLKSFLYTFQEFKLCFRFIQFAHNTRTCLRQVVLQAVLFRFEHLQILQTYFFSYLIVNSPVCIIQISMR